MAAVQPRSRLPLPISPHLGNFLHLAARCSHLAILGNTRGGLLNPPQRRLPLPPGWVYQTRPARHYRFALPLPGSASIRQSRTFISFFSLSPANPPAAPPISPRSPQPPFLALQPHSVRIDPVTPASSAAGLHTRLVALLSTLLAPSGGRVAAGSGRDFPPGQAPKWESRNLGTEFRALPCSTGEGSIGLPCPRPRLGYRVETSLVIQNHTPRRARLTRGSPSFFRGPTFAPGPPVLARVPERRKKPQHSQTRPRCSRTHMVFVSKRTL
jgi:hypothetical protein